MKEIRPHRVFYLAIVLQILIAQSVAEETQEESSSNDDYPFAWLYLYYMFKVAGSILGFDSTFYTKPARGLLIFACFIIWLSAHVFLYFLLVDPKHKDAEFPRRASSDVEIAIFQEINNHHSEGHREGVRSGRDIVGSKIPKMDDRELAQDLAAAQATGEINPELLEILRIQILENEREDKLKEEAKKEIRLFDDSNDENVFEVSRRSDSSDESGVSLRAVFIDDIKHDEQKRKNKLILEAEEEEENQELNEGNSFEYTDPTERNRLHHSARERAFVPNHNHNEHSPQTERSARKNDSGVDKTELQLLEVFGQNVYRTSLQNKKGTLKQITGPDDRFDYEKIRLLRAQRLQNLKSIPEKYIDYFTLELLADPYETPSGYSYERFQLVQWLEYNFREPITRDYMREPELRENVELREEIDHWVSRVSAEEMVVDHELKASIENWIEVKSASGLEIPFLTHLREKFVRANSYKSRL
mmetsp:Transcript_26677/g.30672  ORF Transcript_26677/g.30672 Transcript_26677/m.30672 type:complete len:474 (+) Transcript_26677:54-1475(+)